jgi:hypothetical protein
MASDLHRHAERYYGKYRGEVTANDDDSHQGGIEVKVPSIFGTDLKVRALACFTYGHFFVPAVGDKVWVEFEGGDPQYPIWVGTWYPQSSTPQESRVSPPANRVIQTASGHTIELDDTDDKPKITIRHKDNSFLAIDDKGSVIVANKNGSTIYLNADKKEATLMSEQGHLFAMNDGGMVLMNKDGSSLDLSGDTVRITASKIMLEGTTVTLGAGASEPTLLGQQFYTLWTRFLVHTHATAMGPSGPAVAVPPAPLIPTQHLTAAVMVK